MIRWGILGAGNIAKRFAASLENIEDAELYAISGRSEEKLESFRNQYPCNKTYTDHLELIKDERVDAIYLALPHGLHCEYACLALAAKRPVLCEKPAAMSAAEMKQIRECSKQNQTLFMEAMKTRFVPLYRKLRTLIKDEKIIGDITRVETSLCISLPKEYFGKTYHTDPVMGGALLDSGIYCASWLEDYCDGDIRMEKTLANLYGPVNMYVKGTMKIGDADAVLETAFDRSREKTATIYGTAGTVIVPELHRPVKAQISVNHADTYTLEEPYEHDDFYGQIRHFMDLIKHGNTESDIMPLNDSVRCAEILDILRDGFTAYDQSDLDLLACQEKALSFTGFSKEDAEKLGNLITDITREFTGPVAVRITSETEESVWFEKIMDGKSERNLTFAEMKRNAVKLTGHSSAWAAIDQKVHPERYSGIDNYYPTAGAFPVFVGGKHVATVAVSGLHEGLDHNLLTRAISSYLGVDEPNTIKKAII